MWQMEKTSGPTGVVSIPGTERAGLHACGLPSNRAARWQPPASADAGSHLWQPDRTRTALVLLGMVPPCMYVLPSLLKHPEVTAILFPFIRAEDRDGYTKGLQMPGLRSGIHRPACQNLVLRCPREPRHGCNDALLTADGQRAATIARTIIPRRA